MAASDALRFSTDVDFSIRRRSARRRIIVSRHIARGPLAVSVADLRMLADTKANQIIERQARRAAQNARACLEGFFEQMSLTDSTLGSSQ
jgi:hypothetical protein